MKVFMFFVIPIFSSALCGKIQTSKDEIDLMKNPENDNGFFHIKSCWKQNCFGIETNTTFEIIRKSNGSTFIITRGVVTDTIGETHCTFDESFCSNDENCPLPKCPPNDCLNPCMAGKLNSFIESNLIGEDHRVTHVSLAIEVDNGNLRAQSRLKNNNKSPRLSSIPR